jgi:EmrB/QacA subfamily drug resistance transporter
MSASPVVHRWRAFALLAVSYFMTVVDLTIVNVSLPTIGRDLHLSPTDLQWVVTAYAVTLGGLLLLGGRAADLLGRRRMLMVGVGLFTAASFTAGLAGSSASLIASRAIQGVGAAVMLPAALSTVTNMFAEGTERNKALGIWGGLGATGGTVGLILGGVLTRYVGWQAIFFLNVPIGLISLALTPRVIPESRVDRERRRFDLVGGVTGTAGLMLAVGAIAQASQHGWTGARTLGVLTAAVALLVAFVVIELRSEDPVLPFGIFRSRTLVGANLASFMLGASFFAFVFTGTLYMQNVLHYSAVQTGFAWALASVISMTLAALSQALVTRIGPKPVMTVGLSLIGIGILWATRVPVHGHFLANLAGPFAVAGAGTAFSFIPISVAALSDIREHQAGLASGLLNTSSQLGSAFGTAVASSVAVAHTAMLLRDGEPLRVALTGGYEHALIVLAGIALIAVPAILALVRRSGTPVVAARADHHEAALVAAS